MVHLFGSMLHSLELPQGVHSVSEMLIVGSLCGGCRFCSNDRGQGHPWTTAGEARQLQRLPVSSCFYRCSSACAERCSCTQHTLATPAAPCAGQPCCSSCRSSAAFSDLLAVPFACHCFACHPLASHSSHTHVQPSCPANCKYRCVPGQVPTEMHGLAQECLLRCMAWPQ